jgi:uncharacterized protein (DUF1778 family)
MSKRPKRGRPRRVKKVSEARLVARCSEAELEAAEKAAAVLGEKLSEFIRAAVAERAHRYPASK